MRYVSDYEAHKMYDDMLDDCYPETDCAGMKYQTSRALKELDETAYRCGFVDWCDAEDITTDPAEANPDADED